jgi:N-acyl-D-amino-acid deacylase
MGTSRKAKYVTFLLWLALFILNSEVAGASTLIMNTQIIDGRGGPAKKGAVRIEAERIIAIGDLTPFEGEQIVDAKGLVLAPGFIDTHSHHDDGLAEYKDALPILSQGITTIVLGQDGKHVFPLAESLSAYETNPASVNIASYAGHNTIRELVMGEDYKRHASADELSKMRSLLKQELATGALGLSTGLEYEPGLHSNAEEVLILAQDTAKVQGRYISHIRSEDRFFWDAIEEIINIGEVTGMPVQISHLKLAAKMSWGKTKRLLARLNEARTAGIEITADIYPYEYWESTIWVLLPDRNADNLKEIQFVLDELTPANGIIFTDYKPRPSYVGKTIEEIALILGLSEAETVSVLMKEAELWSNANDGASAESIMGRSMRDEDIAALLAWPHINLCSDGGYTGHPRGYGAFPRGLCSFYEEQGDTQIGRGSPAHDLQCR